MRLFISLALAICTVHSAGAQERDIGSIGLSGYAGGIRSAYDVGADGGTDGPIVGLKVSYPTNNRSSVYVNVAYANTHDVGSHVGSNYFLYNDTFRMATVGGEYAVAAGTSSLWLSLEAGARWRRTLADGSVGSPPESDRGRGGSAFSIGELLVPGIAFRRQILPRGAIGIGVYDYIMSLESPKNSPAVTLSFTFR